jgi:hypothetical protein
MARTQYQADVLKAWHASPAWDDAMSVQLEEDQR